MELKITFRYKQQYLPTKRHRKVRTDLVDGFASFPVRVLSEEAFPLALEVEEYNSIFEPADTENRNRDYRLTREPIRTDGDRLYRLVQYTYGSSVSEIPLPVRDVEKNISGRFSPTRYCPDLPATLQSVLISDNRDEVIAEIAETVANFVWYDGALWRVCSEPMYNITTFGLGHNHGSTGFFIDYHYNPNIPNRNYFNALQREEAIAYGIQVAKRRGDTKSIPGFGEGSNIIVHKPEMVRRNPMKDHGEGDSFLNDLSDAVNASDSPTEAGLLAMILALR